MKIKGAKAVHYDSGPNMTPLVDVVMVILIFLMLTGSFGAAAHFLPSSMPISMKGKGQIDPTKIPKVPDPQLEIFVASKNRYEPGWTAHDAYADPKFVSPPAFDVISGDWRLAKDSPAINHGCELPREWLDPLRGQDAGAPDMGALPLGAAPLRVGPKALLK